MKKTLCLAAAFTAVLCFLSGAYGAYHHLDEKDGPRFQKAYPGQVGTKLDDCTLCHQGNSFTTKKGNVITESSCQYCHSITSYGEDYGENGENIEATLNPFGLDYRAAGRSENAFAAIEDTDSDNDTFTNIEEIEAVRFPGDANDDPSKKPAPHIILSLDDLENDFPYHEQFMLMNTSRGGTAAADYYATYGGVPVEDLLEQVGARNKSTGIDVVAPDGFHFSFPYEDEGDNYFINGTYPEAQYWYDSVADKANGGWVDYTAPGCQGRENGQMISVANGLRLLLAYKQDGAYEDVAYQDEEDKLQGDGPFRLVPPQRNPGYPDRLSTSDTPDEEPWPYDGDELYTDHNAGNSARGVTAIKVEPLPDGTTEYDWQNSDTESGWAFLENKEIVIYGYLRNGDITGLITDATTGEPIERALVSTDRGGYSTLTDADGTYALYGIVTGPDEGNYRLTVSASNYASQSQDVVVKNKEEAVADFSLSPAGDSECPVETVAGGNNVMISRFRTLRDRILGKSLVGLKYIRLYYIVAPEVSSRIKSSATLSTETAELLAALQPHVMDIFSEGWTAVPDQTRNRITAIIELLKDGASPQLAQALKILEKDLRNGTLEKACSFVFN